MKKIIAENQRGFLVKNGQFVRMLEPGVHSCWPLFGEKIIEVNITDNKINIPELSFSALRRDPRFVESTAEVVVPDEAIALRYCDGRLFDVLTSGEYCFWNVERRNVFEIIDTRQPEGALELAPHLFNYMNPNLFVKISVEEGTLGLLYYDGVYKRVLKAGKYYFWNNITKVSARIIDLRRPNASSAKGLNYAEDLVDIGGLEKVRVLDDLIAEGQVARITVPDNRIALVSIDGRLSGAVSAGDYYFWKVGREISHELIDVTDPVSANQLPDSAFSHIGNNLYAKIEVSEGQAALLYFNGAYQHLLESGAHYFWLNGTDISYKIVDMRWQQLELNGQEILTADKVSLRLNFICRYKIDDPVKAAGEHKNLADELHALAQLTVREVVGRCRLDELLRQKESLSEQIQQKLVERQGEFYVTFSEAGLRDIILPGEIREIMNQVLVAEKAAQASVITRREEIASTRSLLETSKLLEENATLYRLKEMEFIERICDKIGNISLDSGHNILDGLRRLIK